MDGVVRDAPRVLGEVGLLRAVHDHQGSTRAALAREMGMTSGFAAETIARLTARQLLIERPAPPSGVRGRPTMSLHPHPDGPLVAIAAVAHEVWEVAAMQLGGAKLESVKRHHRRDRRAVLAAVAAALATRSWSRGRIRAAAVSVPGTVTGKMLAQAPNLGWHDVDLSALWPDGGTDRPLLTGNDATFAAIAESRGGGRQWAAPPRCTSTWMPASAAPSWTATASCWGPPVWPVSSAICPLVICRSGAAVAPWAVGTPASTALPWQPCCIVVRRPTRSVHPERDCGRWDGGAHELEAIRTVGRSFGRGVAGLVDALDPDIVTIGGLGRDLLDVAGEQVKQTYLDGLMKFRTAPAPALTPAHFGDDAPLIGAAEDAFSVVLTDEGLRAWSSR